jgi:hypothetical protein
MLDSLPGSLLTQLKLFGHDWLEIGALRQPTEPIQIATAIRWAQIPGTPQREGPWRLFS